MTNEQNNKRIVKNTLMLYLRQILILLVSLYTVRVVLNVLGVEDYGIYSVVAGVVSFFSFLSGTLASATQRFFSFALGKGDFEKLKKTFSVNLIIYFAIAFIAVLLLETIGLWFVSEKLTVPPERFEAALFVYHFSVFAFFLGIIKTPFDAIIIAHEDMQIYAYVSIVDVLMKLGIVYLLMYISMDKLELYGVLMFVVAIINAIIYVLICTKKYSECQFRKFYWDKNVLIEITGFTGWTLFGQITTVMRFQAVTILLNQMFNPVIVAAQSIARNLAGYVTIFAGNFNTSLYPPIIKYYAADDKQSMFSLIYSGSKIAFFLLWVFALPMLLEMDTILKLWLKTPPLEAVLFTQLALVEVIIQSISMTITTAARAPGKMKTYELSLGIIQIAIFVASWIVLKMGGQAYTVFVIAIIANFVMFFVRLVLVRKLIGLPLRDFTTKVIFPVSWIVLLSAVPAYVLQKILPNELLYSFIVVFTSVVLAAFCMYYIGLNNVWREKVKSTVVSKLSKPFRK